MLVCSHWQIGLALLGICLFIHLWRTKYPAPLPPGPKPLPLFGNAFDMPSDEKEWITWAKLGEQYGDICSLTVFGQTIIIINSAQVAIDMLDKKSSKYSERPVMQMGGELCGWKNTLVLLNSGQRFRSFRKGFHRIIGTPASMKQFHPVQEFETRMFLRRLLVKPEQLSQAIRTTAGAIILKISHGYSITEHNDPLVALADRATEQFSMACLPGAFLVDVLPILRYIPDWMPGARFKKTARDWCATLNELAETPYRMVKDQMAAGIAPKSYTSMLLEDKDVTEEREYVIKWSAASLYSGGADTTVAAIHAFFLAMTLHPEVQEKARTEIDSVCGLDRLPTFADRDDLPYINAVCKETLRFHAVVPSGVPHRVVEDDIHSGYFIPKNSLIIINIWKMLHDPQQYPDPFHFNPDRFLGPNPQRDPHDICFGFGRRICPGRVFADTSIWLTCAQALAILDIRKAIVGGTVIEPIHEQTRGAISRTRPFQCSIKPRSGRAASLVMADD